jgi:hypothetical protein
MCLIKGHEGVCDYILFMGSFLERAGVAWTDDS